MKGRTIMNKINSEFEIENGKLVAYTGNAEKVIIPDGVTSIGSNAFGRNERIREVHLPDSVKEIESVAFAGCSELAEINLQSVKKIGTKAFSACGIEQVAIWCGTSIGEEAFGSCRNLKCVSIGTTATLNPYLENDDTNEDWKHIANFAFSGCKNLKSVTINEEIKEIGEYAFFGCERLTEINMPNTLTHIGKNAFEHSGLETVKIPNTVSEIPDYAFANCEKLHIVQIPCVNIGVCAFHNCLNLSEIQFTNATPNPISIGEKAFFRSGIRSFKTSRYINNIGSSAFSNCACITSVSLPDTLETINADTFSGCIRLQDIKLPKNLKEIGASAFCMCEKLEKIDIPDSVTKIGKNAFSYTGIKKLSVLKNVKTISERAFANCKNLIEVNISDIEVLEHHAFENCTDLKEVTINSNVLTKICNCTFENCENISKFIIPDGVEIIEWNAFALCSALEQVDFPKALKSIDEKAFIGCTNLKEITLPNQTEYCQNTFEPNVKINKN